MNVTRKDIDKLNAIITVKVEKADYEEKVEKSLRAYRKKANFPGFRPGMVPMSLVKKMYGKAVLGEEINKVLSDALFTYIKDNNLNVLGEPLPNETEQQNIDFDTQEEFEFLFDIALAPEVTTTLTAKDKVPYYEVSVDEKMVNDQIDMFSRRFGQYIQVDTVEENDILKGTMIEMENGAVKEGGIKVEDATLSPIHMKEDAQKQLFLSAQKEGDVVFNPQVAFGGSEVEIASLLKMKKEEVKELNADFTFHIEGITRYQQAEINQALFDKVYGEGAVADEAAFRTKVSEGIANDLKQEGAYRFGIDAKALLMKKNQKVEFPEDFLKRWLLATNEKMTQETLDKDFPAMLDELKWQLIKDKLAADNEIKVEENEVEEYAKYVAKMQFAQYGITGVEDDILANYAKEMMKKQDQVRGMLERVLENKVFELIKGMVKLENKTITMEQLQELYK